MAGHLNDVFRTVRGALTHPWTTHKAQKATVDKKKIKKDKVRSAWISFAGRIVAQIVGAVATVALGA